jgi:hypothetical protein
MEQIRVEYQALLSSYRQLTELAICLHMEQIRVDRIPGFIVVVQTTD